MTERLTNGAVKAMKHRVRGAPYARGAHVFFTQPSDDFVIKVAEQYVPGTLSCQMDFVAPGYSSYNVVSFVDGTRDPKLFSLLRRIVIYVLKKLTHVTPLVDSRKID